MSTARSDTARLERRARILEYVTIGWNVLEVAVTVGLGIAAGSLALIAFGTDSLVEVFASVVVVWHLRHPERRADRITGRALRLVAVAFLVLAVLLVGAVAWVVVQGHRPDPSPLGIAYLAVTAVVMFGLAVMKRSTGSQLRAAPLLAEARMTFLDGLLATGVLIGLAVNALFGWWWADSVASLLVAAAAASEGFENWEEAGRLLSRSPGREGEARSEP